MKKMYLWSLLALMGAVLSFTSCGGDDDEGGGAPATPGVLDHDSNLRLTKAGDYRYFYDANGLLDYITSYGYKEYVFEYSPNRIIIEDDETADVSYTGSGYLSSLKANYSFTEDEGKSYEVKVNGSGSMSLSYDGSGHLTSIVSKGNETVVRKDGSTSHEESSEKYNLNWKNNMLMSVSVEEKWVDGEESEEYYANWTFSYDQDQLLDNTNKHHQYAHSVGDIFEEWKAFCYIGLMGRGPLYLPTGGEKSSEEIEDGKSDYKSNSSYVYTYRFNNDGSLNTCYVNRNGSSNSYSYSYETLSNDDSYKAPVTRAAQGVSKHPIADLFRAHKHRR